MPAHHPLAELIVAAAEGRFPAVDGGWHLVPPWRSDLQAIVAFTGHAVLALTDDVPVDTLTGLGLDGFGGAHDPRLIAALAGPGGWIDSLDAIVIGRGRGVARSESYAGRRGDGPDGGTRPGRGAGPADTADALVRLHPPERGLRLRPDLADHPRARYASDIRSDTRVFGCPDPASRSVVILSRGLGGLLELSFELDPHERGTGRGTALVRSALHLVPEGDLVVASVAPGNAASLRSLLRAGFQPVGSVQLFRSQAQR